MAVTLSVREGSTVLSVSGEVDLQTSPELRAAVLQAVEPPAAVVIDLAAVRYMDSSGVASLVEGLQRAREVGVAFVLASPSPSVRRLLDLSRLDRVFTLCETVEEALQAVTRAQLAGDER